MPQLTTSILMPCSKTNISDDNIPTLEIDVFNVISKNIPELWKVTSRPWKKLAGYLEDKERHQMYLKNPLNQVLNV